MTELSLCMIVKNEESVIGRCLSIAEKFADEIIVVDTGSEDGTKRVCERFTDKVFDFEWIDDFSAARNFAFSKATKPLVMWLDADDVVSSENVDKILEIKSKRYDEIADTVMCKYVTARADDGSPAFSFYRERIMKREFNPTWEGFIHECIPPFGRVTYSDVEIDHAKLKPGNPWRNLHIYQKKLSEGAQLDSRNKLYYGRELADNRLYSDAIHVLEDCLSSATGVTGVEASETLSDCYSALGKTDEAVNALCRAFNFGAPRAETICKLASLFAVRDDRQSAFWYQAALCCEGGLPGIFRRPECMDFVPYVELSCCYYRLGEKERAKKYHEMAFALRPNHPSIIHNAPFFTD
ncbi:MAG: glycosyltransferase family 2 protein [Clostridia bacterium]|nr:glycosyltransferase family 2 protein [Clostridia bacterium]